MSQVYALSLYNLVISVPDPFLPPASAVEVIKTEPSVCVSVCVSVSVLTAEPFDIRSRNLVQGLTLIIPWRSLKVKVIGHRSRSSNSKM